MHRRIILFAVLLLFVIVYNLIHSKDKNGYEGDLVPIKNEVDSIAKYEQAVKLLLANNDKLEAEEKASSILFKETGRVGDNNLQQCLYNVLNERKLRFPNYTIQIENNDTTITFESNRGDFSMRGNHNEEGEQFTIFRHSIVYTTKKSKEFINKDNENDTSCAVIKIKDRYYYHIRSELHY